VKLRDVTVSVHPEADRFLALFRVQCRRMGLDPERMWRDLLNDMVACDDFRHRSDAAAAEEVIEYYLTVRDRG
jgi:hypothetical protein